VEQETGNRESISIAAQETVQETVRADERHPAEPAEAPFGSESSWARRPSLDSPAQQLAVDHGVDDLAGSWSEEEYREFCAATAEFGQVDKALWQ
jgi:hypothetical protein